MWGGEWGRGTDLARRPQINRKDRKERTDGKRPLPSAAYLLIDVAVDGPGDGEAHHAQDEEGELPPHAVEGREEHEVQRGAENVAVHLMMIDGGGGGDGVLCVRERESICLVGGGGVVCVREGGVPGVVGVGGVFWDRYVCVWCDERVGFVFFRSVLRETRHNTKHPSNLPTHLLPPRILRDTVVDDIVVAVAVVHHPQAGILLPPRVARVVVAERAEEDERDEAAEEDDHHGGVEDGEPVDLVAEEAGGGGGGGGEGGKK